MKIVNPRKPRAFIMNAIITTTTGKERCSLSPDFLEMSTELQAKHLDSRFGEDKWIDLEILSEGEKEVRP